MQYQKTKVYENALDHFNQVNKQKFEQKDFYDKCEDKTQVLCELSTIENIAKSYKQDNNLKASQLYASQSLVNALNIVQQKMRNLKYLFEQREDGLYGVWLWKQGEQYLVIVDDQIPCKQNGNNPQLATVISKYEWPIILEKAIGKLLGFEYNSLKLIKTDSAEFYIQMITGSEIYEQEIQSFEELQKKGRDQQNIYYVKYTQDQRTIASVITITQNNQQEDQKLVKLIAPNEQSVFLKGRQKDDSSCYLTWEEFKQNFQTVNVLVWKDEYRVTPITLQKPKERKSDFIEHTYCYKFKIDDCANYQINLWQNEFLINQGKIEIKDQKEKRQLGLLRMLLFQQLKENQYKFIDGLCDFQSNISINPILDKGEYCILCQGYFNTFQNYTQEQKLEQTKLILSIKGLQVPEDIVPDYLDELKQIQLIKSLIKQGSQIENIRSFNIIGQPQIQVITNKIYGFLYFYYENRGTIDIKEEIEFIELGCLIKYESLDKQNKNQVDVKQNNFQILLYTLDPKIILEQDSINFQFKYTHKLIKEQELENNNIDEIVQNQYTKVITCDFIDAYINQHKLGITIQFKNNSNNDAQIELQFTKLKNLALVENPNFIVDGQSIKISIKKISTMWLLLDVIEPSNQYDYKMTLNCSNNLQ